MGLTERINRNIDLSWWEGEIPVNYVYTYGLGLEEFFRKLKDQGKFLASRCESCGITYLPARVFCERCFSKIEGTFQVPGTGKVYAHTVAHFNLDESPKKEPAVVALIDMDETDCRMVHYLVGVKPEEIEVGMAVKPVLKPKKERKGHIEDIEGFKPA
ncbi:MAG: Zn-ribbon domain-containing OB-fold protein [Actinomycetota bacterium]